MKNNPSHNKQKFKQKSTLSSKKCTCRLFEIRCREMVEVAVFLTLLALFLKLWSEYLFNFFIFFLILLKKYVKINLAVFDVFSQTN